MVSLSKGKSTSGLVYRRNLSSNANVNPNRFLRQTYPFRLARPLRRCGKIRTIKLTGSLRICNKVLNHHWMVTQSRTRTQQHITRHVLEGRMVHGLKKNLITINNKYHNYIRTDWFLVLRLSYPCPNTIVFLIRDSTNALNTSWAAPATISPDSSGSTDINTSILTPLTILGHHK